MTNNRTFWLFNNIGLTIFYLVVLYFVLLAGGNWTHPAALIALVIVGFHVLEIPLAWKLLAPQNPSVLRVILGTTLYGFTWWLPAKRGIYKVS